MAIIKTLAGKEVKEIADAIAEAWSWGCVEKEEGSYHSTYKMRFENNVGSGTSGITIEYDSLDYPYRYVTVHVPQTTENGGYTPYTATFPSTMSVHLVRTNSALLIQFYNSEDGIVPPVETTTIIVAYATNHYTGLRESVISVLTNPAIDSTEENILYTYIGSQDVLPGETGQKSIGYVPGNSKVSVLTPFFYRNSRCTLDDVYLFTAYQPPQLYRGDCTINGKRYYVCNLVAILDE